tara:strand:+ start:213 stop:983 length:771 start_codon:yes stop_codon:yes gene_type:complete
MSYGKISQNDISFYNENGFLILENVYTKEFTKRFLQSIRRHANKDFAAIINPDRFETLIESDERPKSDITIEEIQETSNLCKEVIANKIVIDALRNIQGSDIVGLSSQMIFKEAYSSYSSQAWRPHQDNRYIDNKNGQYITANWFLRKSEPENGGIYVYPGTHKLPLLPAPHRKSFREDPGSNPGRECEVPEIFLESKKDLVLSAGSVVILHGNCIHGSYANNSNRSRPWYSSCYITRGEYYNVGRNSKRVEIDFD